jgi:hypothetical protein
MCPLADIYERNKLIHSSNTETSLNFNYGDFLIVFCMESCYSLIFFINGAVRLPLINFYLDCYRARVCEFSLSEEISFDNILTFNSFLQCELLWTVACGKIFEVFASDLCLLVGIVAFFVVRIDHMKIDINIHLIPIKNYSQI